MGYEIVDLANQMKDRTGSGLLSSR